MITLRILGLNPNMGGSMLGLCPISNYRRDLHRWRRAVISQKLREEILLSGDCAYCGGVPTQVDHILPRSRGGTDDPSNLAPACKCCNMEKLNFTPDEYRAYREESGLGWPPESVGHMIKRMIRDARAAMGDERVDGAIAAYLNRALPPTDCTPAGR